MRLISLGKIYCTAPAANCQLVRQCTHDMSGYAGQNIGLTFHASTDGAGLTSFYVDDVEIRACGVPAGAHRIYLPVVLKVSSPG
jgi:hypothetical protein